MTSRERLQRTCKYYETCYGMSTAFKTEAEFLRVATAFLETAGALVIRQAYATKKGISDLICCYKGRFLALELKDDTGAPSQQQKKFISDVLGHEGRAAVVDHLLQISMLLTETLQECGE